MKKLLLLPILLSLFSLGMVGPIPTNVVLVKFPDKDDVPCTAEHAGDVVFGQYGVWLLDESRGITWLEGDTASNVWGWVTLPHPQSYYRCTMNSAGQFSLDTCSADLFYEAALAASPYFNPFLTQSHTIFVYNGGMAGSVTGGTMIHSNCESVPSNGAHLDLPVMIHEGGHAQGLAHFAAWSCLGVDVGSDYTNLFANGCGIAGDPWQASGPGTHYSTWARWRMGWLVPSNMQQVASSQIVEITRADIQTNAVQLVEVKLDEDWRYFYTLEYRPADAGGVLVRMRIPPGLGNSYPNTDESVIVNNSKGTPLNWTGTWIITDANPFQDPYRNITITVPYSDSQIALVSVAMNGGGSAPPGGGRQKHPRGSRRIR